MVRWEAQRCFQFPTVAESRCKKMGSSFLFTSDSEIVKHGFSWAGKSPGLFQSWCKVMISAIQAMDSKFENTIFSFVSQGLQSL